MTPDYGRRTDASPASAHSLARVLVGVALFGATFAFIFWQNSRFTVLWDLSFLLDSSWRFRLGAVPYRSIPFSHAPLTFLIQAAVLYLFGRVYWHTIVYSAIAGGLGTVLTWRLLVGTLRPLGSHAGRLAAVLAAPLAVLGIYSVYPHPIYDSDACLAVLIALSLLQRVLDDKSPDRTRPPIGQREVLWSLATGAACVLPCFFKINIGLAFLGSTLVALAARASAPHADHAGRLRSATVIPQLSVIVAAVASFAFALVLLQRWAGIGNYFHWTVQFAAARRLPGIRTVIDTYRQASLLFSLPCAGIAVWLLRRARWPSSGARHILAAFLLAFPFLWTIAALLLSSDAEDRADRLLSLWPYVLVLSAVLAILDLRKGLARRSLFPWVLLATIHGTFISQQLWGSTYAIWPLLILLIAGLLARAPEIARPLGYVISVSLLLCGAAYSVSHERLSYIHLEGQPARASLPALRGMTSRARGSQGSKSSSASPTRRSRRTTASCWFPAKIRSSSQRVGYHISLSCSLIPQRFPTLRRRRLRWREPPACAGSS